MKKTIYCFLLVSITLSSSGCGTTKTATEMGLLVENNCDHDVSFTVTNAGDRGQNVTTTVHADKYRVVPNIKSPLNNPGPLDVSICLSSANDKTSKLQLLLSSGSLFTKNKATFTQLSDDGITPEVEHNTLHNPYTKSWSAIPIYDYAKKHLAPISPTFTISSCSTDINITGSELEGIERVVIFGDSLSDDGSNMYNFSKHLFPPSQPYYNGMFSNGLVWSEQLHALLNKHHVEINNYAYGGAFVLPHADSIREKFFYSLKKEVSDYNKNKQNWANDERRLAIFFIGGNDYLVAKEKSDNEISNLVNRVVNTIKQEVREVGAEKTIIIGLPNIGEIPFVKRNQEVKTKLSSLHNQLLRQFAAQSNGTVKFININDFFEQAVHHTEEFNKKYHTELDYHYNHKYCLQGYIDSNTSDEMQKIKHIPLSPDIRVTILKSQQCTDPWHYIFWDSVHPTYQMHKVIFQHVMKVITGKSAE